MWMNTIPQSKILIPPKRTFNLDHRAMLNVDMEPEPHGGFILDRLFFMKNQFSEEKTLYQRICSAFHEISSGYDFEITISASNKLSLHFAYNGLVWRDSADCGLGLQDLLIILYFAVHPKYEVVFIEEPENHMHPDMQRKLLNFFKQETKKQWFLTTHSNVFLDSTLIDKIFFTHFDEEVIVDDATTRASILNDLGYTVGIVNLVRRCSKS